MTASSGPTPPAKLVHTNIQTNTNIKKALTDNNTNANKYTDPH
jgi:hypothetical protein